MYQYICHTLTLVMFGVSLLFVSGCGQSKRYSDLPAYSASTPKDAPNQSVGRFKTSYLADQIDTFYRGTDPGPIGVTTFVNLDDLYSTSSFGRMVGEQLMSELAMKGYDIVELRHSDALQFLSNAGEFALSRQVSAVKSEQNLGGVIVGTYVASPERVYLNARLLDPRSSVVLSAGSVEMEKTKELARLLRSGGFTTTLERIPVKHLGLYRYPMNMFAAQGEEDYAVQSQMQNPAAAVQPELPKTAKRH